MLTLFFYFWLQYLKSMIGVTNTATIKKPLKNVLNNIYFDSTIKFSFVVISTQSLFSTPGEVMNLCYFNTVLGKLKTSSCFCIRNIEINWNNFVLTQTVWICLQCRKQQVLSVKNRNLMSNDKFHLHIEPYPTKSKF